MMGEEQDDEQQVHLNASRQDMENLLLDDDNNNPPSRRRQSNGHKTSDHLHLTSPVTSDDDHLHASLSSSYQSPKSQSMLNSILEPPSYADVVYNSFSSSSNGGMNGHGDVIANPSFESGWGSSSLAKSEYLYISVLDPLKEQDLASSLVPGGTTYITYLITTRTNLPDYGGSEFSVRRRFRDVVTLSDRLAESYRGYFIPLRPDKSVVESQVMQKQEFVDQRRVALEKYLRKLADHPVIKYSDDLRVFLQVQGRLPLPKTIDMASRMLDGAVKLPKQLFGESVIGAVDVSEVSQPAKGGRDLLRIFKELRQSVTNDWGSSKPAVVEEDKDFIEKKEKLQDFEHQISNVSQQAELLVKAQQDIGETMGELGLVFVKLTKFEVEEAVYDSQKVRAADTKNIATAAVKVSRLYRELNAQTVKHLDKLHEYLGIMLAANNAFSDRTSALLTVQTLLSDLSSLQSRIEKLEVASSKIFGGDKSRIRKIEELKESLKVTEDAKSCAVKEYERIKQNNKNELDRLDKERQNDLLNMLKGFVVNQAGYAEKMAYVWESVAEETSAYAKDGC